MTQQGEGEGAARPTTMRNVVVPGAGSYDRLTFADAPIPKPGREEVLVEVKAAGVNYADVIVRMGLYQSAKDFVGRPITPGLEVAGVVTAVGADVDNVVVGDEVVALTLFDGYATHVVTGCAYVYKRPDASASSRQRPCRPSS